MRTLRKLAMLFGLSVLALAMPTLTQAAPAAGISEAAPAITAAETPQSADTIQKAYWHRWGWHRWHRWGYWHRCWHCWHRWHYWHRYYWHPYYYW